MLPAGFEPASEARKAPILDRTRLRERGRRVSSGGHKGFCRTAGASPPGNFLSDPVLGRPMPWKIKLDATNVFLICGILIILLGWASDYVGLIVLHEAPANGGHGAGNIITRLYFPLIGLAFAAGGAAYEDFGRFFNDPLFTKRYLLQGLFLADGALHLYAFNDHLNESLVEAAFFLVLAPIHIGFGLLIVRLPPKYDPYILAWPVFLIGLLAVALVMPIWPLSAVEDIYDLTVVSKLTEGMMIVVLLSLMKDDGTLNWTSIKRAALAVAGR